MIYGMGVPVRGLISTISGMYNFHNNRSYLFVFKNAIDLLCFRKNIVGKCYYDAINLVT